MLTFHKENQNTIAWQQTVTDALVWDWSWPWPLTFWLAKVAEPPIIHPNHLNEFKNVFPDLDLRIHDPQNLISPRLSIHVRFGWNLFIDSVAIVFTRFFAWLTLTKIWNISIHPLDTKVNGRTHGQTHARTDNPKTIMPPASIGGEA